MSKIRLLIVDDSALARQLLAGIFAAVPDIEVVGTAGDAYAAREGIKSLAPDVLTLDVEMPGMDGLTFLGRLMRLRPMPVVMVSALTERGAEATLRALELGAVDFVPKPRVAAADGLKAYADELVAKVRVAARSRAWAVGRPSAPLRADGADAGRPWPVPPVSVDGGLRRHSRTPRRIVGIGASTGGTEAIKAILAGLPAGFPAGIVVSQHIPAAFSGAFARRVDGVTSLAVAEAGDGQPILPGHVYIAPGDRHLRVERSGTRYLCRLDDGPPVNRHKPSVEVMIRSLAHSAGRDAIGLMLTGMGSDGAAAMGELRQAGATVLAQDEHSSVVWGMPGEVVRRGFADAVLPLGRIADHLVGRLGGD